MLVHAFLDLGWNLITDPTALAKIQIYNYIIEYLLILIYTKEVPYKSQGGN